MYLLLTQFYSNCYGQAFSLVELPDMVKFQNNILHFRVCYFKNLSSNYATKKEKRND